VLVPGVNLDIVDFCCHNVAPCGIVEAGDIGFKIPAFAGMTARGLCGGQFGCYAFKFIDFQYFNFFSKITSECHPCEGRHLFYIFLLGVLCSFPDCHFFP
jgi:hypothetical protein